ncbi:MAG TPA: glycosyltransferase family 4 protein [Pirellulales bacterium]|nr:glycosyltransferase family 4 protein [Pirellulales bacterium]
MKIALLSYEYPPDTGYGGIGTYTFHHARALVELGHEVTVFCGATRGAAIAVMHDGGVRVVRVRTSLPHGWERYFERDRLWWTRGRMRNALAMAAGVEELSRQHAFDVVEAPECGAEAMLVAAQGRWPLIIRFHSPAEMIMRHYDACQADQVLSGFVERLGIYGAARYTACSAYLAREAELQFKLATSVTVIPNGLDLAWFDRSATIRVRERAGIPSGNTVVFFGGRLERRKGADLLADIMSPLLDEHPVSFVVAGADNHQGIGAELRRRLGERPDSSRSRRRRGTFHDLGKLGLDEMRSWLRAASIALVPSHWENCPYSCLEAMAAGRAIVASRVGGLPELVEDGVSGLLVGPGDVRGFQRAIVGLVEDRGYTERLGQAARRTVEERFTAKRMAERSLEEYRECVEQSA